MCAMTVSSFAATYTAKVKITMSSENVENRTVTLRERADLSDGVENGYDSPNPNAVGLYVVAANNSTWLEWGTNNLEGTKIGMGTGSDESYTFTFTGVVGSTYKLYDAVANVATPITEGGTYGPFSAAANSTFNNRFSIVSSAPVYETSVTTNEFGWATFSYDMDLVPVDATAQVLYKGAINGEFLDLLTVADVKAGEGVIVNGAANTTYYFNEGTSTADFEGNDLHATATYNTSMKNVFVLKGNAFLEYVGTNALAANKAYIQLPAEGPNNAPKRITMRFNGTTAVDNVEAEAVKAEKFIENGQVFIRRGNEVYNLQGQIVK